MSVQDYIAKFEDLILRCNEREHRYQIVTRFVWGLRSKIRCTMIIDSYDLDTVEKAFNVALKINLTFKRLVNAKARCSKCKGYGHEHRSHTVTRFVWGLRSKIRRAMITGSYDLDTVEEAFDVTLKINLTFKRLVNVYARCFKCRRYGHYNYQCPSESRYVRVVPNDIVDLKVVEDVNTLPEITSIVENILVDSSTSIINEVHVSSDGTSDDVDEIIESNILTVPSKLFEFSCADYGLGPFLLSYLLVRHLSFFVMIQHVIFGVTSYTNCLEFVSKSNIPSLDGLDVRHPRHPIYLFFYR